ncbi:MAG: alpha/beta fold hydrolase [Chloroflexota bacterium]
MTGTQGSSVGASRPDAFSDPLRAACPATCPSIPDERRIGLAHRFVTANGVRFHVVEAGDPSRPLVLLLHGFPEFWYGWRHQLPALAERFHVVAPDLRGYNLTEKPPAGYDYRTLITDVPALIAALGAERAHVVGHDWGGMLAWGAAIFHPGCVDRLAVLNAPHPAAFLRELQRNPKQLLRSWYISLFQPPILAEGLLTWGHGRGTGELLQAAASRPGIFSQSDLAAYRRAICRPGAAHATLAYYRALWRTLGWWPIGQVPPVAVETLLIWGLQDVALEASLAEDLQAWVPRLRVEHVSEAGHWVQHEAPAQVNEALLRHLGAEPA